jgi:hypothetical protein
MHEESYKSPPSTNGEMVNLFSVLTLLILEVYSQILYQALIKLYNDGDATTPENLTGARY